MSKRKPEDDKIDVKQEPQHESTIENINMPIRAPQKCGTCHQPKHSRHVKVNGVMMEVPHVRMCAGKCTNISCDHKSHRVGQRKVKQKTSLAPSMKAAILAGFKPEVDDNFTKKWEGYLQKQGLTSQSLPGPAHLDKMIAACNEYAMEQVQQSAPPINMSSASANSVVRMFETGSMTTSPTTSTSAPTSTSTPTKTVKLQCTHCSWIPEQEAYMKDVVGTCDMCGVGRLIKARVGAVFSPHIFKSAMQASCGNATSTSTSTPIMTSTLAPTSSTSTSTSTCSDTLTPIDPHDIHDLTFDNDDDDHNVLPIQYCFDASTQTEPKTATVATQTNHTMEFPHLKTSTTTPLNKVATVSAAFACKKPLAPIVIEADKENMSHVANTQP